MNDIIVDLFAGGGGASAAIERALGRSPDIAVNHDHAALAMHEANHPRTKHLCGDVWDVRPREVCGGRHVSLLWMSPDCTHHSKAKGGKPLSAKRRALAEVGVRWARTVRPDVIMLENVEEFQRWGPLGPCGRPIKSLASTTFRRWVSKLEKLGYAVEWRELRACDYGAPTSRKRLFLVARCDGNPIVWPTPTHGPGLDPYRTAAECIDWSIPCPSIFTRSRPLAEKTLARIARGIRRFVLDHADPFVIPLTHVGDHRVHSIREPPRTITGANRGELAFVSPTLIQTGYGERKGQAPRSLDLHQPLGTVVAGGAKHALVAAFLAKHYGGNNRSPGLDMREPTSTVTCVDHHSLVSAHISKLYGTSTGHDAREPLHTVTSGGCHLAEVCALLARFASDEQSQLSFDDVAPLPLGHVRIASERYAIVDIGMRMLQPRELFRAQGFPDSYIIDPVVDGKPLNKTAQIRMCGNSVSPPVAAALVRANVQRLAEAARSVTRACRWCQTHSRINQRGRCCRCGMSPDEPLSASEFVDALREFLDLETYRVMGGHSATQKKE